MERKTERAMEKEKFYIWKMRNKNSGENRWNFFFLFLFHWLHFTTISSLEGFHMWPLERLLFSSWVAFWEIIASREREKNSFKSVCWGFLNPFAARQMFFSPVYILCVYVCINVWLLVKERNWLSLYKKSAFSVQRYYYGAGFICLLWWWDVTLF